MFVLVEEDGKVVVKASAGGLRDYRRAIRSRVYAAWKGHFDLFEFIDIMARTLRRSLTRAWYEGAKECGVLPDELTVEEQTELQGVIDSEISFTVGFGVAIIAGSQENGGKLRPLHKRAEMWINRYPDVQNRAKVSACANQKLLWQWTPGKEHCSSCILYHGRIYRGSVWKRYGIRPQMESLECGGLWHCGCNFIPTTDPATPGRPPGL